jgi:glycosyltransferase involved in cell wall biosynthesis
MELVSIVLPVYNCEKTLSKAIESILSQNYYNFELIIVNDGSNDASLDVIKSFKDNRIKLINRSLNKGLVYSLNEGIYASNSDLVFRMDADDISLPNRLTCQLDFLKKINFEFSVVGTNYSVFVNGIFDKIVRHPHSSYILPYYLIFDNYFCHPSVVLNKKLLNNSLTYNSNFNSEDYELFSRIIKLAPAYNINFEGIVYNSLESGRSKLFVDEIYNDRLSISLNYLNSYNSIFSMADVSEIILKWDLGMRIKFSLFIKLGGSCFSILKHQTQILNRNFFYSIWGFLFFMYLSVRRFYINKNFLWRG